jgi:hypothetical protein
MIRLRGSKGVLLGATRFEGGAGVAIAFPSLDGKKLAWLMVRQQAGLANFTEERVGRTHFAWKVIVTDVPPKGD